MSKKLKFSNPAMKKSEVASSKKEQFNLAVNVNSFNAIFDLQKLDSAEEQRIHEILEKNWIPDNLSQDEMEKNFGLLKTITSEIKSISRQGAILIGERVVRARELLKPFRDGTFTLWLESTFGSRQSGYNMLSYYEFFVALPSEDLKSKYKKMAQRAAYQLASRKGDIQKKFTIIDQHYGLKSSEIIGILQREFSTRDLRSRKTVDGLINRLLETVDHLVKRRKELSAEDLKDIKYANGRLQEILKR
ncbi:MAG: CT583 family protein [Chlamydiia bacterium]|nr:CT583 family protein [Simkania sp.]MCB1073350.1 CT583 family protein [Chlamydiia bacterium]MCP5491400.1 CT583 family protein [Chlamydiales bacterium]